MKHSHTHAIMSDIYTIMSADFPVSGQNHITLVWIEVTLLTEIMTVLLHCNEIILLLFIFPGTEIQVLTSQK